MAHISNKKPIRSQMYKSPSHKSISMDFGNSPYTKQSNSSVSFSRLKPAIKQLHHNSSNSFTIKPMAINASFISPNHNKLTKGFFQDPNSVSIPMEIKLEKKLAKELRKTQIDYHFEVYEKYFSEIIKHDKKFTRILSKIKSGYEQKIGFLSVQNFEDLLNQIKDLKDRVLEDTEDKMNLIKELEGCTKENKALSRALDKTESLYLEVQEKLEKIYKVDIDSYPQSEYHWRLLVSENKKLRKINEKAASEYQEIEEREKQCIKLILEMKERGYPVKEIYENMKDTEESQSAVENETENEDLISGKPKNVQRPKEVPQLKLENMEESSDNSQSDG